MPISLHESPISPKWLPNGHFQSIFPALTRKVPGVTYRREKIETADKDFLDLDWSYAGKTPNSELVILSHGLEGNSTRQYMLGMVRILNENGFDCLAWNFRGCGGEMNKTARFYHSGATEDLAAVVAHALPRGYQKVHLIGFSLGGNLTLKYLGELGREAEGVIANAVVFSVPMDLKACSLAIIQARNRIYMHRFMNTLHPKVKAKAALFPERLVVKNKAEVRTLYDFDDVYTAPLHGFKNADDYYTQCSSRYFIQHIAIPTLIINAQNDPIVPFESLPLAALKESKWVTLLATKDGGHCGFRPAQVKNGHYWSEWKALEFLNNS